MLFFCMEHSLYYEVADGKNSETEHRVIKWIHSKTMNEVYCNKKVPVNESVNVLTI